LDEAGIRLDVANVAAKWLDEDVAEFFEAVRVLMPNFRACQRWESSATWMEEDVSEISVGWKE
jgi:hypothetical protein